MIYTNISPLANLYNSPNKNSELETQCLFGDKIYVISEQNNWFNCKLIKYKYKGWVEKKYFRNVNFISNFKVKVLKSNLYNEPNLKSKKISSLFLNSLLHIDKKHEEWSELKFNNKKTYIFNSDITELNNYNIKIIEMFKSFIGTPYLWGGSSFDGIDCSGLIQTVFEAKGINFPRNTSDQINFKNKKIKSSTFIEKNCLVFWKNHVGFLINKNEIIHSSGQKMAVVRENIKNLIKTLEKDGLKVLSISKLEDEK